MRKGLCVTLLATQVMGAWVAVAETDTRPATKKQSSLVPVNTNSAGFAGTARTNPVIAVSPRSLDFASVKVGRTRELTFTVRNVGGGVLTGAARVSAPFSIVGGSHYSLASSQSQAITVQYGPQATGLNMTVVLLTGAGGASITVAGSAVRAPRAAPAPPQNLRLLAGP